MGPSVLGRLGRKRSIRQASVPPISFEDFSSTPTPMLYVGAAILISPDAVFMTVLGSSEPVRTDVGKSHIFNRC